MYADASLSTKEKRIESGKRCSATELYSFYRTGYGFIISIYPAGANLNSRAYGDKHLTYTPCVSGELHITFIPFFLINGDALYVLACCESTIPVCSPLTFQMVIPFSAAIVYRGLLIPTRSWGIYF